MCSVYLRSLSEQDIELCHRWHGDQGLYETLGGAFRYVSIADEEAWLRSKQAFSTNDVNLAVCLSENGQHIGNIYLRNIEWVARRGDVHLFIGDESNRGKGYGQTAVRLLIKHAFDDLGLHRLCLYVLADNTAAVRLYEKCGFSEEGRLRHHAFKGGAFKDVLVMGLCAADPVQEGCRG